MGETTLRVLMRTAALVVPAVLSAQAAPGGDATKGKDLFLKYSCYACHGFSGQNKVLSDEQLTDIHAYIKTLPESRPAKDIPALNQFKEQ